MDMILSNTDINVTQGLDISSSWEDIATVINFGTAIQREGFNIAVQKGVAEGLYAVELVEKLRDSGCTMGERHIYRTLEFYEFKLELSQTGADQLNLSIPETAAQFNSLGKHSEITSAVEKAEEFTEVTKELGKQPSREEIRDRNKIMTDVKKGIHGDETPKPKGDQPKYFNTEQLAEFRDWLKKTYKIDAVADKPDANIMELSGLRDDILNDLASRYKEWKIGKKIMRKLLHPDTGGNTLAYQFYEAFEELMQNLTKSAEYIEFGMRIDEHKKEWWKLKRRINE